MNITEKERVELIRKGNQLFNEGHIKKAGRIFETIKYVDGLIRIGDYYYKKRETIFALLYYQKAGYRVGMKQIISNIVNVFITWLREK